MSERKPLVFTDEKDLTFHEEPVQIGEFHYVLREANGEAFTKRQNVIYSSAKVKDGGINGWDGVAMADPVLVASCLFRIEKKDGIEQRTPVRVETVLSWKPHIVEALAKRIKEVSRMEQEEDDEKLGESSEPKESGSS